MNETAGHPKPERLEAYAEGTGTEPERAAIRSHLTGCARCRMDVDELEALFAALAALPKPAPAPDFGERVMRRVPVRRPWPARLAALVARLLPTTTVGWALAAALFALPTLVAGGAAWWVASRPWLTLERLLLFGWNSAVDGLAALAGYVGGALLESEAALWLLEGAQALAGVAPGTLGATLALYAALTTASVWILYDNLISRPIRGVDHVSLCV